MTENEAREGRVLARLGREGEIGSRFQQRLARIIHECRCEAAETEARRGFLASKGDAGVLAVRRGDRTRKAAPGERIGRCSRHS
jgi:hypothetical protein